MKPAVRVLSGAEVERGLAMATAVEAVREAFIQLSSGRAEVPLRTVMPLSDSGTSLFMPAGVVEGGHFGLKVVSVVPDNISRDLPTIHALVTLFDRDVAAGTHINAIGAYRPDTREIPGETVARSRLVVDSRSACRAEAGELVMAIEEGLLDRHFEPDEIGEIASGFKPARSDEREVTVFKSVGNAVQDLAVAGVVFSNAQRLQLGTEVTL